MATSSSNEEKGVPQGLRKAPDVQSFLGNIRGFFSPRKSDAHNYELDAPSHEASNGSLSNGQRQQHLQKLEDFRRLTGIWSASEHRDTKSRPARNLGIYARVCKHEQEAQYTYKWTSKFITSILGGQILVAATLTALGAGNGPHVAVTLFGAINTVIAGILTYLKNSGLPDKHKILASSWGKVREYIEQREREFERPECDLDVKVEIEAIEKMYKEVRQDRDVNQPDRYTSTGQIKKGDIIPPVSPPASHHGEYNHMANSFLNRTTPGLRAEDMMHRVAIPQTTAAVRQSAFNGSATGIHGGSGFPGPEDKSYEYGGDISRPTDFLRHPRSTLGVVPSHLPRMESPYDMDHPPHIAQYGQNAQDSMAADKDRLRSSKFRDSPIEEDMRTRAATGAGSFGSAGGLGAQAATGGFGQMRAVAKDEIEELRGVAKNTAERLHTAGEQILGAARTVGTRVDEGLGRGAEETLRQGDGHGPT
ncbi:MAG: hypothetical protein MMC33_005105 [Icmadophila ericetorum]|nr:hypothetical protein [Icmadophila ericetorum]